MGRGTVQVLTERDLRDELADLQSALGIPMAQAEALEPTGVLTPEQYSALTRMRDVLWLLEDEE